MPQRFKLLMAALLVEFATIAGLMLYALLPALMRGDARPVIGSRGIEFHVDTYHAWNSTPWLRWAVGISVGVFILTWLAVVCYIVLRVMKARKPPPKGPVWR